MKFREFGLPTGRTIVLLHGGGLSWWSLQPVIGQFASAFHVVTPVIDGHGEAAEDTFISIEDSARKLLAYLDEHHGGRVFALAGLSVGAQLVVELLSLREDVAQFAVVESALVCPLRMTARLASAQALFYGLIRQRWFSRLQAKALCLPASMLDLYYADSVKMQVQSLVNLTRSNAAYVIKPSLSRTQAHMLILVGEREIPVMRKSARRLSEVLPNSMLLVLPGLKHGEFSLRYPAEYAAALQKFFKDSIR